MSERQPIQTATEKQIAYVVALTTPERLAQLTKGEANFLIRFHSGPPRNASRAQQLFLYGMLDELDPAQLRALIDRLASRRAGQDANGLPAPAPGAEVAP